MFRAYPRPAHRGLSLLLLSTILAPAALAQTPAVEGPWFGVPLPPVFQPHVAPAIIGDRGPVPAIVPPGEGEYLELRGATIRADLETIVRFSRQSRERREIGSGQLWGRITGFPSGRDTIAWAAEQFRAAGIEDVELQRFEQAGDAAFWLPLSWEMRLVGGRAFGSNSENVVLTTAMPLAPSELPVGGVSAPLVHVGTASAAELVHIDVRGRIAVQHVTPQAHTVFERTPTVPRARALFERGAVGVINVVDQPGNEMARDFSNCGGPCFNLGGRDGVFLETVMDRAAEAGVLGQLRVRLSLDTDRRSGLSAHNGVGPQVDQPAGGRVLGPRGRSTVQVEDQRGVPIEGADRLLGHPVTPPVAVERLQRPPPRHIEPAEHLVQVGCRGARSVVTVAHEHLRRPAMRLDVVHFVTEARQPDHVLHRQQDDPSDRMARHHPEHNELVRPAQRRRARPQSRGDGRRHRRR